MNKPAPTDYIPQKDNYETEETKDKEPETETEIDVEVTPELPIPKNL